MARTFRMCPGPKNPVYAEHNLLSEGPSPLVHKFEGVETGVTFPAGYFEFTAIEDGFSESDPVSSVEITVPAE